MAAGRATETSDSDWASCRRVRICLVSTDRRPLRRVDLQARDEDPLLAATVNMQYAARHDYAFVLTSYRAAALDGRAYGWSKVAVLGELMDTWPEVEAFAFLDADASINTARRLESLPAVGRFLSNPERLVFFVNSDASRAGPPSKWASWTDEHGRLPSRQEYADRARDHHARVVGCARAVCAYAHVQDALAALPAGLGRHSAPQVREPWPPRRSRLQLEVQHAARCVRHPPVLQERLPKMEAADGKAPPRVGGKPTAASRHARTKQHGAWLRAEVASRRARRARLPATVVVVPPTRAVQRAAADTGTRQCEAFPSGGEVPARHSAIERRRHSRHRGSGMDGGTSPMHARCRLWEGIGRFNSHQTKFMFHLPSEEV